MGRGYADILACETPERWLECAIQNLDILLIDHANCEKKAAATAMNLMYRHVDKPDLLMVMSQLAREELLHFQQVVMLLKNRGVHYIRLGPSRYASGLRKYCGVDGAENLTDLLIIGAFIEARSCERFTKLVPFLDGHLARFYRNLVKSESRHFVQYLELAERYSTVDINHRVQFYGEREKELVLGCDDQIRFHSGTPL